MRRLRADIVTLVIALAVAFGWLFVWLDGAGALNSTHSWYDVRGATLSVGSLATGASVTMAGIKVGRVTSITQQGDGAVIGMEIDKKDGPIPVNSHFGLSLRTIVGENYVALYRGTSKHMLASGGMLGPGQDEENVDFDQILSTLQGGTRAAAEHMIAGLGDALANRGPQLNDLLSSASGTVDSSAPVTQVIAEQHTQVSQLTNQLGQLASAIGQRGSDIREIATTANTTFSAIAARDNDLAQTVERLPTAMKQVRATTGTLHAITGTAAPVLANLAQAVTLLHPAVDDLKPAAEAGNTLVQEVGKAAPPLVTTLSAVRAISKPAAQTLPQLHGLLCQANPALQYLSPYGEVVAVLLQDMGSATNYYDANGHAARLYATVGADTLKYASPQAAAVLNDLLNNGIIGTQSHLAYDPLPGANNVGETYSPSLPTGYLTDKNPYPRIKASCSA